MREYKFRAWDKRNDRMMDWSNIFLDWEIRQFFGNEDLIKMQYTGLKDKNGKEIYEGDISKPVHPYSKNFEINISLDLYHEIIEYNMLNQLEIIGNIYQNAELLHPKDS